MRNRARVEIGQLRSAAGALAAVFTMQASAQTVIGIPIADRVQITSGTRVASDEFGVSVAISGTRAIIGAPGREGFFPNSGAAYIYSLSGSDWGDEFLLQPDAGNTDRFGASVDISGDIAVVGAPLHASNNSGAAYVYRFSAGAWQAPQLLLPPSPANNNNFGYAVATSGGLVLVGEIAGDGSVSNSGLVHVYRDNGSTFLLEATLAASDAGSFDQFGAAIAVDGETIIVGAPLRDNMGGVYVFQNSGGPGSPSWATSGPITPPGIAVGDQFGISVAIDGIRAIAGASNADPGGVVDAGAAYIIDSVTTSPVITPLTAPAGAANDYFGFSVSIWDARAVIGAYSTNLTPLTESGEVHVFNFDGSTWNDDLILRASDADSSDYFGYSVSAEQHAVIGAFRDDGIRGSAYFHDLGPTTPPDADGDGLPDAQEVLLGTNPNVADTDGDTLSDGTEVLVHGTNPLAADTDGDTLADAAELNTHNTNPLAADTDGDTLSDAAEINTHGTNPIAADTDMDGLNDGAEIAVGTNPFDQDTEDDGLWDGPEITLGANPFHPDTDGDGLTDGWEVDNASMGCPSPTNADSDGDGLSDGFEATFDPALDPCDQDLDADSDGVSNAMELQFGTDPLEPDTDGDGLTDGAEVEAAGMGSCPSPLQADSDGDTLSDGHEMTVLGTSPCNPDTDGDGADDALDTTPTDPGVEPDIIEGLLLQTSQTALGFDADLFVGNSAQLRSVRRFVMGITLRAAANAVSRNRDQVAIIELQLLRRRVDGSSTPPDWMTASPEQAQLLEDIDLAISWIQLGQ